MKVLVWAEQLPLLEFEFKYVSFILFLRLRVTISCNNNCACISFFKLGHVLGRTDSSILYNIEQPGQCHVKLFFFENTNVLCLVPFVKVRGSKTRCVLH